MHVNRTCTVYIFKNIKNTFYGIIYIFKYNPNGPTQTKKVLHKTPRPSQKKKKKDTT